MDFWVEMVLHFRAAIQAAWGDRAVTRVSIHLCTVDPYQAHDELIRRYLHEMRREFAKQGAFRRFHRKRNQPITPESLSRDPGAGQEALKNVRSIFFDLRWDMNTYLDPTKPQDVLRREREGHPTLRRAFANGRLNINYLLRPRPRSR